jgi:dsRNA-specific ribonuclease
LADALILGRGERLNTVHTNDKVLFAHMQALFGAIWIECRANHSVALGILIKVLELEDITRPPTKLISVPIDLIQDPKFRYLQLRFGHKFSDTDLLLNALIRQSALEEKVVSAEITFQTLEFLEDKVLECTIAEWVVAEFADEKFDESLTPLLDGLVCNSKISVIATRIRLGDSLIIGAGEECIGVRTNQRRLADHVEALIAALWLDVSQNYKKTKECVLKLFRQELKKLLSETLEVEKPTPSEDSISWQLPQGITKSSKELLSAKSLSFWSLDKREIVFVAVAKTEAVTLVKKWSEDSDLKKAAQLSSPK